MGKRSLGLSGVASALLTIMLLVAGFAASAGLLSAVYVSQAEAMRRAVNVGEAVSERLQAYVYEDVRTNRTLLTVRNVGSTGSEVEYLMAVGYGGEVLAEVRPAETLKLGTQQALTVPLADLLGLGFDNYTQVRSVMATLYLKTVKGGVFGSGYMAPPSVMTAAHATSTTTITTEETHTETLPIETGTWTVTSWTATVIMPNPERWHVESYVGAAFADTFEQRVLGSTGLQSDGFPSWGLHPGLRAKRYEGSLLRIANVTSADQIRIPRFVACWKSIQGRTGIFGWGGGTITKLSELGPTYIAAITNGTYYGERICPDGGEIFDSRSMTRRYHLIPVGVPETTITGLWTGTFREGLVRVITATTIPTTTTIETTRRFHEHLTTTVTTTRTHITEVTTNPNRPPTTITWIQTTTERVINDFDFTVTATKVFTINRRTTTATFTGTATVTVTWSEVLRGYGGVVTLEGDYQDVQKATFPGELAMTRAWVSEGEWYWQKIIFRLAYVKAVNLWNTTEVLAFLDASQGGSTIELRVDRPVGLAAVYVYDRTVERLPPPPPPPIQGSPGCAEEVYVCPTYGYGSAIQKTSSRIEAGPCDSMDGEVTVTFRCTDPNDQNCGAWIVPGTGVYSQNEVQLCPKNPDGTVTCRAPAGSTIIAGQAQRRQ